MKKLIAAGIISGVALSGVALAKDDMKREFGGKQVMVKQMKRMAKMLDLTDDQKTEIKALMAAQKETMASYKEQMKTFKGKERELIQSDNFNEAAFLALQNEYQITLNQAALERARMKHKIWNVLNQEQREKWKNVSEKRAEFSRG
ncbi:Spy/CpxP family protein refolding chaperone [Thalassotalea agarivorans]|nr:Spy/CpxP family protein refolding chaperone [Thalassotalea agarivorans]